ncbi:MAG: nucleotidyltransferase domain-containing protein [bacterium]|nr:nucleotidyltransferase domain-containing protein [bacterium]
MLEIFNSLEPFFKESYRRINVREYARMEKISPPSASKYLKNFHKENMLEKEEELNYIFYVANKKNVVFISLSQIYWHQQFKKTGLLTYIEQELINPVIILFGSFAKAEITENSDIDIAIFSHTKKRLDLNSFEKNLGRKIQIFYFQKREEIKNKELLNNILNGYKMGGNW